MFGAHTKVTGINKGINLISRKFTKMDYSFSVWDPPQPSLNATKRKALGSFQSRVTVPDTSQRSIADKMSSFGAVIGQLLSILCIFSFPLFNLSALPLGSSSIAAGPDKPNLSSIAQQTFLSLLTWIFKVWIRTEDMNLLSSDIIQGMVGSNRASVICSTKISWRLGERGETACVCIISGMEQVRTGTSHTWGLRKRTSSCVLLPNSAKVTALSSMTWTVTVSLSIVWYVGSCLSETPQW